MPAPKQVHRLVETRMPPDEVFSTMEHCLRLHTGGSVHREGNSFSVRNAYRNVTVIGSSVNGNVVITSPQEGLLEVTGLITFATGPAAYFLGCLIFFCLPIFGAILIAIWITLLNSQKPEAQFEVALEDFEKRLRLGEKGGSKPANLVLLQLKPVTNDDDHIVCPVCGNRCRIQLKHLGKRVACPKCKTPFAVPPAPPPKRGN